MTGTPPQMDNDDRIRAHYRQEAETCGTGKESTMRDHFVRDAETAFILDEVARALARDAGATVADIGCGNGYTLAALRDAHPALPLFGVEFTDELFAIARSRNLANVTIVKGDCREAVFDATSISVAICQRVLINLLDRGDQLKALRQAHRILKPGGRFIMIEAFAEPLENLNRARREMAMADIPMPHHNLYFDDSILGEIAALGFARLDAAVPDNLLSTHYFVSRVLHEAMRPEEGTLRNTEFVRFFDDALPPAVGNYSPVRFFLFEKA